MPRHHRGSAAQLQVGPGVPSHYQNKANLTVTRFPGGLPVCRPQGYDPEQPAR
jgi:hypothetical protein